jgi:hypothetical protein
MRGTKIFQNFSGMIPESSRGTKIFQNFSGIIPEINREDLKSFRTSPEKF